jgi:hypothetical protein
VRGINRRHKELRNLYPTPNIIRVINRGNEMGGVCGTRER